ncbi:hypothetical protein D3C71_1787910 [compost metagenome]
MLKLRVRADQVGLPELVLQVADQGIGIVTEENRAHPALALCHHDRPERALADGKANVSVLARGAVIARGHAEHLIGGFVEATVGVEPGVIQRIGHRTRHFEPFADPA